MKKILLFAIATTTIALALALASCGHEHTHGTATVENRTEPTCEAEGKYDEVVRCNECGEEYSRITKSISKIAHTFVDKVCTFCGEIDCSSEGLDLTLSDDGSYYIVSGIGNCTDTIVAIPKTYNNFPVAEIRTGAFINRSQIAGVIIPDSVTSIGDYAFYGCANLTSVTIGNSVTSIGNYAFVNCSNLTSVIIPDSVTSIGEYAFCDCDSLTSVTIGNSVTSIGSATFGGGRSLTQIKVNEGNTVYKDIDGNLYTKDGKSLIQYSGAKADTEFSIPRSVEAIADSAFFGCSNLTSVIIPDSVTSIGYSAFRGCSKLTSVTIPASVTSIGAAPFGGCTSLTQIKVNEGNTVYKDIDGNLYTKDGKSLIQYLDAKADTEFSIPSGVEAIADYAFYYCKNITSVIIPDSVISIGSFAFYDCSKLTSVIIPDSVTEIGRFAFDWCNSLADVYYTGTGFEWKKITINDGNYDLTSARIHYNYVPK